MKRRFNLLWVIGIIALTIFSYTFAYTQEQREAYEWAYKYKITTQPTIEAAKLNWMVTRQSFSKMVVNYIENVVGITWDISDLCSFSDEDIIINDLKYFTKRACAYKIMWQNRWEFRPTQLLNRAQLWTVLSRVLWWNKHVSSGNSYNIYHVSALHNAGIMNNIDNVANNLAKRWDVLLMLKRMHDKFGWKIYLNSGMLITGGANTTITTGTTNITGNTATTTWAQPTVTEKAETTQKTEKSENSNNDYVSNMYSGANIIYTWKDWTPYYYDDKFLKLLGKTAKNKWESDLANYLKIEAEYFRNGLDQLSNIDDEELLKSIWIDINTINPSNMTKQEKEDLIKRFKEGFWKVITENKEKNNKLLKDLTAVIKNIKDDKFWLKEKYKNTKTFMEASNTFLDKYSETIFKLMEIALSDNSEVAEQWVDETFWLVDMALIYQEASDKYQKYIEQWGVNTIKLLGLNS